MTKPTSQSVASQIRRLANAHQVTAKRDGISRMASCITLLSGDSITLDTVEQLLVNLKRKGVMTTSDFLAMQVRYLNEKSANQQKAKKTLQA